VDQVQREHVAVSECGPQRLAVDRQMLAREGPDEIADPVQEALAKGGRFEGFEDAAKGVLAGRAVGQVEEGGEEGVLGIRANLAPYMAPNHRDFGAKFRPDASRDAMSPESF
jgi:hypothetical protein